MQSCVFRTRNHSDVRPSTDNRMLNFILLLCVYLIQLYQELFLNGARFIETNVPGISNGALHIIGSVLYEPRFATNAYTFIRTTAPTFSDPQQTTS